MRQTTIIGSANGWFGIGLLAPILFVADAGLSQAAQPETFERNRGVTVEKIRIGKYESKTRIVLDLSGPVDFDYRTSDHGRTVVVRLPKVRWKAREYFRFGANSSVYRMRFFPNRDGGGGVLSILARKRIGLAMVELLPPWRHWGYRIVLDIPENSRRARAPSSGVVRNGIYYPLRDRPASISRSKRRTPPQTAKRRR